MPREDWLLFGLLSLLVLAILGPCLGVTALLFSWAFSLIAG